MVEVRLCEDEILRDATHRRVDRFSDSAPEVRGLHAEKPRVEQEPGDVSAAVR
jgi:hypothetical protein